jgi:hypothetical protein
MICTPCHLAPLYRDAPTTVQICAMSKIAMKCRPFLKLNKRKHVEKKRKKFSDNAKNLRNVTEFCQHYKAHLPSPGI